MTAAEAETCGVDGCDSDIENFPESFPAPGEVDGEADDRGAMIMCDHHHVSARILAYTRADHPYVDVGLYRETTYYARSLAAETFGIPSTEKVNQPDRDE